MIKMTSSQGGLLSRCAWTIFRRSTSSTACGPSRSGASRPPERGAALSRESPSMRHLNAGRRLNRTSAHRKALMKNLVLSLIQYGRLKTTDAKAKELRRWADRMVTLGKRGDLAARRRAYAFVGSHTAVKKLFDEIAPRFMERPG